MPKIVFENRERAEERKEARYFLFEDSPTLFVSCVLNHLFCIQSRFIQKEFTKLLIIIILFSHIFHGQPILFFSVSFAAYFKLLQCLIEVDNRVFGNVFRILNLDE